MPNSTLLPAVLGCLLSFSGFSQSGADLIHKHYEEQLVSISGHSCGIEHHPPCWNITPVFPGGHSAYFQWAEENITPDRELIRLGQGKFRFQLTLDGGGNVTHITPVMAPYDAMTVYLVEQLKGLPAFETPADSCAKESYKVFLPISIKYPEEAGKEEKMKDDLPKVNSESDVSDTLLHPVAFDEEPDGLRYGPSPDLTKCKGPQFVGGEVELFKWLNKNLSPSEELWETGWGRYYVQLRFDSTGRVSNIHVIRGRDEAMSAYIVEVLKGLPPFELPADQDCRLDAYQMTIPINMIRGR